MLWDPPRRLQRISNAMLCQVLSIKLDGSIRWHRDVSWGLPWGRPALAELWRGARVPVDIWYVRNLRGPAMQTACLGRSYICVYRKSIGRGDMPAAPGSQQCVALE